MTMHSRRDVLALAHARAARLRPFVAPHGGVVLVGEDASPGWAGHTLTCLVPLERLVTSGFSPQQWWDLLETAMADPTGECPSCGRPRPNPITSTSATGQPSTTFLPGSACRACGHSEVELELDAVDGSSLLLDEDATITAYGPDGDAVDAVPFGAVGSNAQVWARYARTMGVDPVLLAGALAYAAIADADD